MKVRVLAVVVGGVIWLAAAPVLAADSGVMNTDTVVNPAKTVGPEVADPKPDRDGSDFVDNGEDAEAKLPPQSASGDPDDGGSDGGGIEQPDVQQPLSPDSSTVLSSERRAEAIRHNPGYSNAANQTPKAKRDEAKGDCVKKRPPISELLGVEGEVVGDERRSWATFALLVALSSVAIAGGAYLLRRRRAAAAGGEVKPRGSLEQVATVVAIFGGLVGLAGQFGARLGAETPPPPEAEITIREVHPRITRGEYAAKTDSTVALSSLDKREVGNVVWLEIRLKGYRDKRLALQWGLYDRDAGEALLPTTAKQIGLDRESADVQTLILPIWVGYPQSERFEAQYRLLEGQAVRDMAATGVMRGSKYRYACEGESTSPS